MPQNPNCVGDNVSPQLSWSGVPEGTRSFALLMEDPEGRGGAGVHHWVAYGIPPNVTSFAEGEVSKESDKYVGGKSTQGVGFYSGPCTPPGSPHHYTFVVVATDFDPKELPPGLTREEFLAKLVPAGGMSHAKGSGRLDRVVRQAELVSCTAAETVTPETGGPRPSSLSRRRCC
jgi:Raf kinase inhibitor-like YbhB/YbcL family protein